MIRAFAAALEDEHLLVKRGVLDLLDQSFRTEGSAFKMWEGSFEKSKLASSNLWFRASLEDQTILMKATIGVVLRRDLTLNRRVYHWLVGSKDETGENQMAYLRSHSLDLLASTLRVNRIQYFFLGSLIVLLGKIFMGLQLTQILRDPIRSLFLFWISGRSGIY